MGAAARAGGPAVNRFWATEDAALARVEVLKARGYWPGVINHGGVFELTFDPDVRLP